MSRWFRFYDDAMNDPKIIMLSDAMKWSWVTLLCVASQNDGRIPSVDHAAIGLRVKKHKAAEIITVLVTKGLLDPVAGGYFEPHNWSKRQFKSDNDTTTAERQARYRERHPPVKSRTRNALRNGANNGDVTRTYTEADTKAEPETDSEPSLLPSPIEIINLSGEAKSEKRSPPRNGLTSNGRIYCVKGTSEWDAYADDFRQVRGVEPTVNHDGGRWFNNLGEANELARTARLGGNAA